MRKSVKCVKLYIIILISNRLIIEHFFLHSFAVYSGLMILIYPIGVPLLFAYLLFKKRERIKKPTEERETDEELLGMEFLFDNYKPQFWYFEIVVTVLRLLLTGVLGLIEPGSSTQLSIGMLIAFGAVVITCSLFPYENERDNVLSILSYVQVSGDTAQRVS